MGILVVAAAVVGRVAALPAGGAVLGVGLAAVWLRGYLVPYTPWFTGRLFEVLPGSWDPHSAPPAPPGESAVPAGAANGESDGGSGSDPVADSNGTGGGSDVVDDLLRAGVLAATDEELSLDPEFREDWRAEMASVRGKDPEALADTLAATVPWVAGASVVTDDGRNWIRLTDEDDRLATETWLSPAGAIADLTAVETLAARTDLGARRRTLAAPPLRQFLERCPACDDHLEVTSPRACCGSPRYVAEGIDSVLACPTCDELVAAFRAE